MLVGFATVRPQDGSGDGSWQEIWLPKAYTQPGQLLSNQKQFVIF